MLRRASERKIEAVGFSLCRYFIAFLRGDQEAMEGEVTQRRAKLEAQGFFEQQESLTAAYQARLIEAARISDRAVLLSRQAGLRERAAQFEGARAVWSALFGLREEGQKRAAGAMALHQSRDADYGPAFALAVLQPAGANSQDHSGPRKALPGGHLCPVQLPACATGTGALNQGNAAKALEMTQVATPYELGVPGTAFYVGSFFGAMYPVYVRGLAYSRLGHHREAAAEFQKILDHPGIVLNDPIGPMARLQLARAFFASGDRAKSAAVYKDLLALWKDADPDIPVVLQAKAESARWP